MLSLLHYILVFVAANPGMTTAALIALYEAIVRRVPTKRDMSIINLVAKIADFVIANKKTNGGLH